MRYVLGILGAGAGIAALCMMPDDWSVGRTVAFTALIFILAMANYFEGRYVGAERW